MGDSLKIKQPKQEYIDRVVKFAKLTGDYSVLSVNDLHIVALAYELECLNNGEDNLRSFPGEVLKNQQAENENGSNKMSNIIKDDDGFCSCHKKKRR